MTDPSTHRHESATPTESTVADLVCTVAGAGLADEPVQGRVVLSQRRLVAVTADGRLTVPLSNVFDVGMGQVPDDLQGYFETTVTIGYRLAGDDRALTIADDESTVDRFVAVLFRALLTGTVVDVVHPARVGGRVTGAEPRRARVRLGDGTVEFHTTGETLRMALTAVSGYSRFVANTPDGRRPALAVQRNDDGAVTRTEIWLDGPRLLNLLGRYLRLQYRTYLAAAQEATVGETAMELLVGLYTIGETDNPAGELGRDVAQTAGYLAELAEAGLVTEGDTVALTAVGRVLVTQEIESVN
jgi:helix-turn-helix protein